MNFLVDFKQNTNNIQNRLSLYMNYLAVAYALFLPISSASRATIFSLIVILFLLRRNYVFYIKQSIFNPIAQALLLYIAMHFVWLLGSDNPVHADKMLRLTEYAIIPFIFLTFLTKEFAYRVITAFISSVLFSEFLSYLIRLEIVPTSMQFLNCTLYEAVSLLDPSPFLLHMHYAITLSIVIALLFFRLINKETSLYMRMTYGFFMLSATLNLSLIGGRSGYLSFAILLISVVLLKFKSKALIPLLGVFIFISSTAYLAYQFSPMFQERINYSVESVHIISSNSDDLNTSMGQRLGLWKLSGSIIKENPIFGVGTGDQMDSIHAIITEKNEFLRYFHHLHNGYIEVFVQFGLIGLLVFLNIFYQIFKYKNYLSDENKNILFIATIAIMIALLTETFSTRYYLPLLAIIISASISNFHFIGQKERTSKDSNIYIYGFIIFIVFITSII